ncbi:MAG TPA: hypothetical protein VIJ93_12410, partial [bacterium]
PLTSLAFLMGWLAISGVLPFGGFFSKDEILWHALSTPNALFSALPEILYFIALFTAFLTAFYITRLVVLVFFGDYRGNPKVFEQLHESPNGMVIPLMVLAVGSVWVGWINVPQSIGGADNLGHFLDPVFEGSTLKADGVSARMEPLLMLASFLVAGLGLGLAWYIYGLKHTLSQQVLKFIPGGKKALEKQYYVDELYEVTVVRWVKGFANLVSDRLIERLLVNRLIDEVTGGFQVAARFLQRIQVGLVRAYLAYVVLGATLLIYLILH